ncbi:MAG: cyclic-di-AMP receptor [Finegoldia sp.]|nr:cyclic-di-AMP receptor [Finegoldia sp.]
MKFLFAISNEKLSEDITRELLNVNIAARKLNSSGFFSQNKSVTTIVAIEDEKLDQVLEIIKSLSESYDIEEGHSARSHIFVLDSEECYKF